MDEFERSLKVELTRLGEWMNKKESRNIMEKKRLILPVKVGRKFQSGGVFI